MMMAGAMHPPFSLFGCAEKRKRAVHGPKEKRALLVLAQVHSVPRSDWRKLDAWTQGLFHWSRASHYPVPFGKDSSSTGGRTAVLPTRTQPGAKRGKRRKSLRPRGKFAVCSSLEAVCFRKLQKVFFSFGPCTVPRPWDEIPRPPRRGTPRKDNLCRIRSS